MKSHTTTAKNPAGRTPWLADAYLARGVHNSVFWIPKGFGSSTHPALLLAPHITSLEGICISSWRTSYSLVIFNIPVSPL